MKRREFLSIVGACAAAWPPAAYAQSPRIPTIGVLVLGSPDPEVFMKALREGLRDLGYLEGQTISLVFRSAQGDAPALPKLAAELVALKPDIIVTLQTPALIAAAQATAEIPIVMGTGDPAATGRVANVARPGGNITGVIQGILETVGKTVELIREMLPSTRRIAVLANATDAFTRPFLANIETAGRQTGMTVEPFMVVPDQQYDATFAQMQRNRADAVIVQPSLLRKDAADLALKHGLPAFSPTRLMPQMGGLASYAARLSDIYREPATYVDKILKGAKPGDLPIAFPTRFELVINLKTAKALGIAVPPVLLTRADEVIE